MRMTLCSKVCPVSCIVKLQFNNMQQAPGDTEKRAGVFAHSLKRASLLQEEVQLSYYPTWPIIKLPASITCILACFHLYARCRN